MTHAEELEQLLEMEREQDIVPFLQRLTPAERTALVPAIKKQAGFYEEMVELRQNVYGSRMTAPQGIILAIACFVCYDRVSIEKTATMNRIFRNNLLDRVLSWYTPSWFEPLLVDLAERDALPGDLTYEVIMDLSAKKLLTPTPPMVVSRLPHAIFIREKRNRCDSAILFQYPETLSEHIWYLFEYPSNIHFSDRWNAAPNPDYPGEEPNWKGVIGRLTREGALDRQRVLEESLKAANRNFNKLLTGWCIELFSLLQPSKEELVQLQPLLLQTLDSPQSKAVSTVLGFLKMLSGDKAFDHPAFLDHLPPVMATGKKSIITTTLQILEKVGKQYPGIQPRICNELCQVFLSKEDDIQAKTAKLITQFGSTSDAALKEQLSLFRDSMLIGTQKALAAFFDGNAAPEVAGNSMEEESRPLTDPHYLLPEINDPATLVFFASQSFEGNETYHIDLLPAVLLNMQEIISTDVLLQMEPAFQRAAAMLKRLPSGAGSLDETLAVFFLNYGKCMADARPEYVAELNNIKSKTHWWQNRSEIPALQHWKTSRDEPAVYIPYRKLLALALQKLTNKDTLPLLSTPTHTPAWIDPLVLIQRLQQYQAAQVLPNEFDLQVAISRCAPDHTGAALAQAVKMPEGEYKRLLMFLLDVAILPEGPFTLPSAWMQAGITKAPTTVFEAFAEFSYSRLPVVLLNGQVPWKAHVRPYQAYGAFNMEKKDYDRYWSEETVMEVTFPEEAGLLLLKGNAPLLQEYLNGVGKYMFAPLPDIKRLLLLTPNHPDVLLARVMNTCLLYSAYYEVPETNMVLGTLQTVHELDIVPNDRLLLFVACCMMHGDRTVRNYAAGYWSSRVPQRINSETLGQMIGQLERVLWAPLKRLYDLINSSMLQISPVHNKALETMLTACLAVFEAAPVKDLKKLLEIYNEVLLLNNSQITDPQVTTLLLGWKTNATLKKITERLLQLVAIPG